MTDDPCGDSKGQPLPLLRHRILGLRFQIIEVAGQLDDDLIIDRLTHAFTGRVISGVKRHYSSLPSIFLKKSMIFGAGAENFSYPSFTPFERMSPSGVTVSGLSVATSVGFNGQGAPRFPICVWLINHVINPSRHTFFSPLIFTPFVPGMPPLEASIVMTLPFASSILTPVLSIVTMFF